MAVWEAYLPSPHQVGDERTENEIDLQQKTCNMKLKPRMGKTTISGTLIALITALLLRTNASQAQTMKVTSEQLAEQRSILLEFFSAVHNGPWNNSADSLWGSNETVCAWRGVTCCLRNSSKLSYSLSFFASGAQQSRPCSKEGEVRAIDLDGLGLQGTVPESLAALTSLEVLRLSNNPGLHSSLPPALLMRESLLEVDVRGTGMSCSASQLACTPPSGYLRSELLVPYKSETDAPEDAADPLLQPPGTTLECNALIFRHWVNSSATETAMESARILAAADLPPSGTTVVLASPEYWHFQFCTCASVGGVSSTTVQQPSLSWTAVGRLQATCEAASDHVHNAVPWRTLTALVSAVAAFAVLTLVLGVVFWRSVTRKRSASAAKWWARIQGNNANVPPAVPSSRVDPAAMTSCGVQTEGGSRGSSNTTSAREGSQLNVLIAAKRSKPPGSHRTLFGPKVTLVATDVEGSTELWEWQPDIMNHALALHDRLMRITIANCYGYEITTEGDAFLVAFHEPVDAVRWALLLQSALLKLDWPPLLLEHPLCRPRPLVPVAPTGPGSDPPLLVLFKGLAVRMGIATGVPSAVREHPVTRRMQYTGAVLRLATGIAELGSGGQVLVEPLTFKGIHNKFEELDVVESEVQQLAEVANSKAQAGSVSRAQANNRSRDYPLATSGDGRPTPIPPHDPLLALRSTTRPSPHVRPPSTRTRHVPPPPYRSPTRVSLSLARPSAEPPSTQPLGLMPQTSLLPQASRARIATPGTPLTATPTVLHASPAAAVAVGPRSAAVPAPGSPLLQPAAALGLVVQEPVLPLRSTGSLLARRSRALAQAYCHPIMDANSSVCNPGSSLFMTPWGSPAAMSGNSLATAPAHTSAPQQPHGLASSASTTRSPQHAVQPVAGMLSSVQGSSEWLTTIHQGVMGYASNTGTMLQSIYGSNTSRHSRPLGALNPLDLAVMLGSRASADSTPTVQPSQGSGAAPTPAFLFRSNLQGLFFRTVTADMPAVPALGSQTSTEPGMHGSSTQAEAERLRQATRDTTSSQTAQTPFWQMEDSLDATLGVMPAALCADISGITGDNRPGASVYSTDATPPRSSPSNLAHTVSARSDGAEVTPSASAATTLPNGVLSAMLAPLPSEAFGTDTDFISSDGHLALAVTLQGGMWAAATSSAIGMQRTTVDAYRSDFGSSSNGYVGSRNMQGLLLAGSVRQSSGLRPAPGLELSLAAGLETLAEPVLGPPGMEPKMSVQEDVGLEGGSVPRRHIGAATDQGRGPGPIAESQEDEAGGGGSNVQSTESTSARDGAAGVRLHAAARDSSLHPVPRRVAGTSRGERFLARAALGLEIDSHVVLGGPDGQPAGDDDEAFLDLLLSTTGSNAPHAMRAPGTSDGSSQHHSFSHGPTVIRSGTSVSAPRVPKKSSSFIHGGHWPNTSAHNADAAVTAVLSPSEAAETAPKYGHALTPLTTPQFRHHASTDAGAGAGEVRSAFIASAGTPSSPSPPPSNFITQFPGASGVQSLSLAAGSSAIVSGDAASHSSMTPESFSFAPVLKHPGSKRHGKTAEVDRCLQQMHSLLGEGSRPNIIRRKGAATSAEGASITESAGLGATLGLYALGLRDKEVVQPGRVVVRRSFSFIAQQQTAGSSAVIVAPTVSNRARAANDTGHRCPQAEQPPRCVDIGPAWLSLAVSNRRLVSCSAPSQANDGARLLGSTPASIRPSPSTETNAIGAAAQKSNAPGTPQHTSAIPGDLEPAKKPSCSDGGGSGGGASGNYGASSLRSTALSQAHGQIVGQGIGQPMHRLASSTTASGSTSPVHLPPRSAVIGSFLTGTEDTTGSQQRCILLPVAASVPTPSSPRADHSSSPWDGHLAANNKFIKALQPGNTAIVMAWNSAVSPGDGTVPADAPTSRRQPPGTGGDTSPLSLVAITAGGGGHAAERFISPACSSGTAEGHVNSEGAALADRLGLRSIASVATTVRGSGRLPRSAILQAASSSQAGHRNLTLGTFDMPELDAEARLQGRLSNIGANDSPNAPSLHSATLLGTLRPVGPRSALSPTCRRNGGGGGRGLVLALRSAMVQEATSSGANLNAKLARDLASEDAVERVGPEDSISRSTMHDQLGSITETSRQDLVSESTTALPHSEVEPSAPVPPGTGMATTASPASEGLQQQPSLRSGTASTRARRVSLGMRTNEVTGPSLLRFVRHLPAYGHPVERAASQTNKKGGGKAVGAVGGTLDGSGAGAPPGTGVRGPPATADLTPTEAQVVPCSRTASRRTSLTIKHRRRSAVELRLATSANGRHDMSYREATRAVTAADGGGGGRGSGGGTKDALHALMIIDMGVHRLNLPALGPAYGDVYDGVQVIQLLPAHLKHRAAYQPPLRSQAQLSPSFFDAPGAAQALMPCAPCTPPTFPRLSLMFIQPAGYSAVANTNLEVAERSGAVFCAAVREVLHVFGAYECQEYECTFMVACTGPRVAAEAGLALHEWLLQADWPSDLLELNEGRLEMALDGRPVRRGFRAKVGIFTGVPLSVVPHATTGRADYFGALVNRAARLMAGAKAGQILLDKTAGLEVLREWRQVLADAALAVNTSAPPEHQSPTRSSCLGATPPPCEPAIEGTATTAALPAVKMSSRLPQPAALPSSTITFGSYSTPLMCSQTPMFTEVLEPAATQHISPEQPAPACLTLPSFQCALDAQTDPMWQPPSPGAPAAWWRGQGMHLQAPSMTGMAADPNALALATADTAYEPTESDPRVEPTMDTLSASLQGAVEGMGSPGERLFAQMTRLLVERRLLEMAANELSASAKAIIVPMIVQVLDLGTYKLKGLSEDQAVVAVQLKPSVPEMSALSVDANLRVVEEVRHAVEDPGAGMGKKAALVQPGNGLLEQLCVALPAPLTAG